MEHIGDRLKMLIATRTDDRLRYVQLENTTGISADRWKNFWFGRKKADAEMIEAVSKAWPENAFWLACGSTDCKFGHVAPMPALAFPENTNSAKPASAEYFRALVRAKDCALAIVERLNERTGADADEKLTVGKVPRIGLGAWDKGKQEPELVSELQRSLEEVHERGGARRYEVGQSPQIEAILDVIRYNYDEAALLRLVHEYREQRDGRWKD
ncbi:MAG: hypothetical protein V4803_16600 [Burkholderia gladioli]